MTRNGAVWILLLAVVASLAVIGLLFAGVIPTADVERADEGDDGTRASDGFDPALIYERSVDGVVLIVSEFGPGRQGLGSGFLVREDGHILTNAHVVSAEGTAADRVRVAFQDGEGGQTRLSASIVGIDPSTDIAVLRVDPADIDAAPLPLGTSADVRVGEPVVAIGNPLGFSFSLSNGIVSGVDRNLTAPNGAVIPNGIQTNAAINQGNSGGPLIDADGEVIGVNEQIASRSGSFSGIGFAVPIDTVKTVMRQLIEEGNVDHAFLGIQGQTITATVAEVLGLPVESGVLVATVADDSPAERAGLRGGTRTAEVLGAVYVLGGDVIAELNGATLNGMEELAAAIAEREPGDRIELTVIRDGSAETLDVTLGTRPGV